MRKHKRWLTILVASGLVGLIGIGLRGGPADESKRLKADGVLELWKPMLKGTEDFQQFVASPRESDNIAAATFRIVGPSFEEVWNHYADLCGIKDRYDAKRFLTSGGASAKGTYVVSDRANSLSEGKRALSVFLLRTDRYTVTATIQPDPDGRAVRGSLAAATP